MVDDGIEVLHGAMHLVPFSSIVVPDAEHEDGSSGYKFSNPRFATKRGLKDFANKEKMDQLSQSIKERTLLQPFVCRWIEMGGKRRPQLVAGRRRYSCIDQLISKQEMVRDPASARFDDKANDYVYGLGPANEVYKKVCCQVFSAKDDVEALALAHAENDNRLDLTEGHDIALVIDLRRHGATDERILKVLNRQAKWLRDTDRLIERLDARTLTAVVEGDIIREGALKLAEIPDIATRHKVLDDALAGGQQDSLVRRERIGNKVRIALDERELALGRLAEAKFRGDQEQIEKRKEELDEAARAVDRTKRELQAEKPVAKNKNVRAALQKVTGSEEHIKRCLRGPKILKGYLQPVQKLLATGPIPHGLTVENLRLLECVLRGIVEGRRELQDSFDEFLEEASESPPVEMTDEEDEDEDKDEEEVETEEKEDELQPDG